MYMFVLLALSAFLYLSSSPRFSSFHRLLSNAMPVYTPTITSVDSEDDMHNKMELVYFSNEFPKDDLVDLFRRLHNHSKDRGHSILAQFISDCTLAIKDEIRQLSPEHKKIIPPFETILSWAENTELREGLLCGAIDGILLIIVQLATYIG